MGNSGSAVSKRRTSEYDESSVEMRHHQELGPGFQPPSRRQATERSRSPPTRRVRSTSSQPEKKALLTTPEVPEALQRLIEDVNMDTMAMQLRQTSISPSSAASTPTGPRPSSLASSPSGGISMAAAAAFRHRSLSRRIDLEEAMAAQGVSMAYVGGEQKLPTVFKWEGGGKEVYVSGSFNDWSAKIQMVKSTHNFYTIVDLPAGKHEYKFIVDGQWKTDSHQPVVNNEFGSTNNVITVKPTDFQVFQALAEDVRQSEEDHRFKGRRRTVSHSSDYHMGRSGSPDGEYGQEIPPKSDFLWEIGSRDAPTPPLLPPQMLHVILNKDTSPHYDPNLLPEPSHVMLNHMYALSIKDGVMVLSLIQRYRKKFVTTVLYKPIDAAGIPKEAPPPQPQPTRISGLPTRAPRPAATAASPSPSPTAAPAPAPKAQSPSPAPAPAPAPKAQSPASAAPQPVPMRQVSPAAASATPSTSAGTTNSSSSAHSSSCSSCASASSYTSSSSHFGPGGGSA